MAGRIWLSTNMYEPSGTNEGIDKCLSLFNQWRKRNNIVKFSQDLSSNVPRFLQTRKNNSDYGNIVRPPFNDHAEEFMDDRGQVFWVYHPYHYPEEVEYIVSIWANTYGLKAEVLPRELDWYYPGMTCTVVLSVNYDFIHEYQFGREIPFLENLYRDSLKDWERIIAEDKTTMMMPSKEIQLIHLLTEAYKDYLEMTGVCTDPDDPLYDINVYGDNRKSVDFSKSIHMAQRKIAERFCNRI